MSEEQLQEQPQQQEEQFEEKRDSKGRRITKKRMESMKKNLVNANKKRLAKKQLKQQVDEYEIQSESDSDDSSSDSSDDDELLELATSKKNKKVKDTPKQAEDPRIGRLETIVANLAQEVKRSHKQLKKANKSTKSEKIVVLQPKNNQSAMVEKRQPAQRDRTDHLIELLKNNVMF
jgi:hypothetical protein